MLDQVKKMFGKEEGKAAGGCCGAKPAVSSCCGPKPAGTGQQKQPVEKQDTGKCGCGQ